MNQPVKSKHESGAVAREADLSPTLPDGTRRRILTGDRPTGRLHLGHYVGSLRNRVRLQNSYDTFILIADVQALTTHFERPELVRESVLQVALDYLAVGLDPWKGEPKDGDDDGSKCKFVVQSMVPSIAELTVFYGLLVPVRSLIDNPTTKAEAEQYGYGGQEDGEGQVPDGFESELHALANSLSDEYGEIGEITSAALFQAMKSVSNTSDVAVRQELDNADDSEFDLAAFGRSTLLRRELRDELIKNKRQRGFSSMPYGFLGYPISQAADITFVGAHLVPVGPDQVPLIELCREVVHRVNAQYGSAGSATLSGGAKPQDSSTPGSTVGARGARPDTEAAGTAGALHAPLQGTGSDSASPLLTEPQALLGTTELIRGLDGSIKMGKSLGNAVYLSDSSEQIWTQLKGAVTDPQRMRRTDPGRPEVCNIFSWHKVFNGERESVIDEAALEVLSVDDTAAQCRSAGIGCVDCKKNLHKKLDALLQPMRERRAYWEQRPDEVIDILRLGTRRASEEGEKTLARLKQAMHIDHFPM